MALTPPPNPTWSGYDANLSIRWQKFFERFLLDNQANRLDRLPSEISDILYRIEHCGKSLTTLKIRIEHCQMVLEVLRRQLDLTNNAIAQHNFDQAAIAGCPLNLAEIQQGIEQEIESCQTYLLKKQSTLNQLPGFIRDQQVKLRAARAELIKLERRACSAEFTSPEDEAKRQLRYITSRIPGVMGVRFNSDGTPVVHIRTSYELNGRRFDFGDYEVVLAPEGNQNLMGHFSPSQIFRSRSGATLYWQNRGGYPSERDAKPGWFCCGDRQQELKGHFERGDFGTYLHLLVNTMSSVNVGVGMESFANYEIPIDAIWTTKPGRQRRRRRARRPA